MATFTIKTTGRFYNNKMFVTWRYSGEKIGYFPELGLFDSIESADPFYDSRHDGEPSVYVPGVAWVQKTFEYSDESGFHREVYQWKTLKRPRNASEKPPYLLSKLIRLIDTSFRVSTELKRSTKFPYLPTPIHVFRILSFGILAAGLSSIVLVFRLLTRSVPSHGDAAEA